MSQMVGVRSLVAVGVGAVVVAAVLASVLTRGEAEVPAPTKTEAIDMMSACTSAAQEKLDPLVTESSGEGRFVLRGGTEWTVTTSVNHKTKWADHWYDVSCVVSMPGVSVVSVETAAR